MKKLLFGTTALVGALALVTPASAGEVNLPGALDLRISGNSDFEVEYVDSDFREGRGEADASDGREFFFNQDHEIRFRAMGVGDATGINYGANLELELQTGSASNGTNANWDEAWIYFGGGWGEFRLGNEDSANNILAIGGHSNNAGTGGLDGAQRILPDDIHIADSGEATKILYFTPLVAGFQAGVSYAINSGDSGSQIGDTTDAEDMFDLGANWQGSFGGADLGVFGGLTSFTAAEGSAVNWQIGGEVGFAGFSLAVGYGDNDEDSGSGVDNFVNVGLGAEFAGVNTSIAYQRDSAEGDGEDLDYYVLSADTGILPGVALRGDIAYADGVQVGTEEESGVNAVIQLRVAF